jgi:hypothetical protein
MCDTLVIFTGIIAVLLLALMVWNFVLHQQRDRALELSRHWHWQYQKLQSELRIATL